jgi:hypothetical protein
MIKKIEETKKRIIELELKGFSSTYILLKLFNEDFKKKNEEALILKKRNQSDSFKH